MTAKEYLSQYKWLCVEIEIKREQTEQLRDRAMSVSYNMSDKIGSSGGSRSDTMGRTVAKLVDAENEMGAMVDRLVALKSEIEETIESVEDLKLRQVLILRYINGNTFERIAEKMNYSSMQIFRLHGKALDVVSQKVSGLQEK